jgi:hypothetical protein
LIGDFGYRRFDGQAMQVAEQLPHPQFTGEDVWASGSEDVWLAAGEHLMHFDGRAWQAETIEIEAKDLHGSREDNLLVAGPREHAKDGSTGAGAWAVARRSGGAWTVELDAGEDDLFVRAHGREGGVAIDHAGHAWLRDASGWHEIETLVFDDTSRLRIIGAWMQDPTHIWAVSDGGVIYGYDGHAWHVEQSDMQMPRAIGASEKYLLLGNAQGSVMRRALLSG